MSALLCPLDWLPCEENCPDRYRDEPGGGCLLTTLMEFADVMIVIKSAAPSAATPGTAEGGDRESRSTSSLTEDKEDCKGNETAD